MCEILDKVENRGRAEGAVLADLEAVMAAEQAMETLDIPPSDRPKYADRI